MNKRLLALTLIIVIAGLIVMTIIYLQFFSPNEQLRRVLAFLRNPQDYEESILPALHRCEDAPFMMPTSGVIGFLWGDSFRPGHRHQGIDFFSGEAVGEAPVYAVYDGYLTRLPGWKSSVIIRIPSDPLQPDRQIWTYYTHMADPSGDSLIVADFPHGSAEIFVAAGTLLGYQGNYSGTEASPTGIHLHFSIVMDDGKGNFLNELSFHNTVDPSPYFQMSLNARENQERFPGCSHP